MEAEYDKNKVEDSMNALVQSLAALGGVRDRDALDTELVRLVLTRSGINIQSANLMRVVGEGVDRRCLSLSALQRGQEKPSRDFLWSDWSLLPKVSDFPARQKALDIGRAAINPQDAGQAVLPIGQAQTLLILLEVQAPQPLLDADVDLLQSILLAYQNLLGLLDYGERDSLTELLNRKTFDSAFFKATADQSSGPPENIPERRQYIPDSGVWWLAVLDIDHFKRVNDNFGHLIGDEVLLLLARLMRGNFRFHDQLYRFGGEEFVILMRCGRSAHAEGALERLRERVQAYAFPQVGTITVSMGVSSLLPNDTPSNAFGRADKAVYYAKKHGRNQVCNYQTLVAEGKLVEQVADEMDVDLF